MSHPPKPLPEPDARACAAAELLAARVPLAILSAPLSFPIQSSRYVQDDGVK